MKYRAFGRTGWTVSEIGFGAWAIGGKGWGPQKDEESLAALRRALDIGVTFIDTAQGYGDGHSEQLIGRVLSERGLRVGAGPVRVLTKIPPLPGGWPASPYDSCAERYPEEYLRDRVERSLRDLRAETIDVVLLHLWSRTWNRDPSALHVLRVLREEGKIQAVGISNSEFDENAVNDPIRAGLLDAVETVYNIFDQNPAAELLPIAQEHKVAVIARSPLDEGALTGKMTAETVFAEGDVRRNYFRGERLKKTLDRLDALRKDVETLSNGRETDLGSLALRFVLRSPAVATTIPGMRNAAQVEKNAAASDLPPLPDELYEGLKKHFWYRVFWLD
jgi:aryl-alcohol dehydrogenase-like predicted oxidoreductase